MSPRAILYTRLGCGLCDELKAELVALQAEFEFTWVERNIEESPEDMRRYQYLIPVLDIEGGQLLYPPHHWDVVRAALHAAREARE